jgi:hypothetical protein
MNNFIVSNKKAHYIGRILFCTYRNNLTQNNYSLLVKPIFFSLLKMRSRYLTSSGTTGTVRPCRRFLEIEARPPIHLPTFDQLTEDLLKKKNNFGAWYAFSKTQ